MKGNTRIQITFLHCHFTQIKTQQCNRNKVRTKKKTNHFIEFIILCDDICYKNNKKIHRIAKKKWSFSNVVKSSKITDKFHETTKHIIRNQCQVHELRTHCNVIHFILVNVRSINFDDYANVCSEKWIWLSSKYFSIHIGMKFAEFIKRIKYLHPIKCWCLF